MPLQPYGERWREQRKVIHAALSHRVVKKYHKLQEHLALTLCNDIIEKPLDFFSSVRLCVIISVSIILSIDHSYCQNCWSHRCSSDIWNNH